MCLWIYQGGRFPLSLEMPFIYIEQRTIPINFLHHHNFRKDIGTLLFGDSQKDQAQNILQSNAVQTFIKNSRQFTEGT